jgi:hypothetical protein
MAEPLRQLGVDGSLNWKKRTRQDQRDEHH